MTTTAFINLQEVMGGDLAVVNSARVSYGKSSTEMNEKDKRLLDRLMRDKHGTPFEAAVTKWYVRCPIFVAREFMRHRICSYNEMSGRYSELKCDFYVPKKFRVPIPDARQMEYQYQAADSGTDDKARSIVEGINDGASAAYHELLQLGIAKEHARMVLPVSIYTEFIWTVNVRSMMNFLSLRNHPSAMGEMQIYAKAIEKVWSHEMPVTHKAFQDHGRIAP